MDRFLDEFQKAARRARARGVDLEYSVRAEQGGRERLVRSKNYGADKKEAASGQADGFERGVIR